MFGYCDLNTRDVPRLQKRVNKYELLLGECFKLFESQATFQEFESHYSNTETPLHFINAFSNEQNILFFSVVELVRIKK